MDRPARCPCHIYCYIAHWRCRIKLLLGKWDYEEFGVFDRIHLRFFTIHSLKKMLEDQKFKVLKEGFSVEDFCLSNSDI